MTQSTNRRVYVLNPALFPNTPPGSPASNSSSATPDAPPSFFVDVPALMKASSTQPNATDRTYGALYQRTMTENDLVLQIENLKELNRRCPELITLAELRIKLAELKSPDRVAMLPLISDAHYDLEDAFRLANEYTLGDILKKHWLLQISTAQKALKTLAEQNKFTLLELSPALPPQAPLPSKIKNLPKPVPQSLMIIVKRVAAGIFAVLALVFTVGVAINRYLIKNR